MHQLCVLQTRFSVYNKNLNPAIWQAGKAAGSDVLAELLDPDRLKTRCDIFFNFSLPLLDQAYRAGTQIVHSVPHYKHLPSWVLDKLQDSAEKYSWFQPRAFGFEDQMSLYDLIFEATTIHARKLPDAKELFVAGIRLDDDDLLGMKYFSKLQRYMSDPFVGFCVCFPKGVMSEWADGRWKRSALFYEAKHAQGIAQINKFDCQRAKFQNNLLLIPGAHRTVDERVPTILDAIGDPVFVRSVHASNDFMLNKTAADMTNYLERIFAHPTDNFEPFRDL